MRSLCILSLLWLTLSASEARPPKMSVAEIAVRASRDNRDFLFMVAMATGPQPSAVTCRSIQKNPAKYANTPYWFTGRIEEIHEGVTHGLTTTEARISCNGDPSDMFFVILEGETEFVRGDMVDAIGAIVGPTTYKAVSGWRITVPSMIASRLLQPGAVRIIAARLLEKLPDSVDSTP